MTKEEIIEMARQADFLDYELDDGTTDAFDKRYETFAKLVAEKTINDTQMATKCTEQPINDTRVTPKEAIEFLVSIGWSKNKVAKHCKVDHSIISRISNGHTKSCNYMLAYLLRDLVYKIKTFHVIRAAHEKI